MECEKNIGKERELLSRLAEMWDSDISLPLEEGIAFERELAKLYMPQLDSTATEDELLEWGKQFKNVVKEKLEMFRQGKLG
jgi:hypothetical protein